ERRIWERHRETIESLEQQLALAEEAPDVCSRDVVEALRKALREAHALAFQEIASARHEVALAKVPYVIEHVQEALESGPVILFAHHKDVIEQLQNAFKDRCCVITGSTKMADRQKAVDDFQSGAKDLFIGNIQAAGVGITLTKSSHVVFAELTYVPGDLAQASSRAHRIGQRNSVLVQY